MNDWAEPSNVELDELTALATRPENRKYFFDHLDNPKWVSALAKRGYFSNPPKPVPSDEPGYVQFPPWPEGRYLVRMAPLDPSAVAKVLKSMPPSGNPLVTKVLLECVKALPSRQFKELAPKTFDWITNLESIMFIDISADAAASTICRLLQEGETKQGLKAAKGLLQLESRLAPSDYDDPALRIPPEPVGRLSDWEYKQAIQTMLPDLVDSAGIKALELFSRLLRVAVDLSKHPDEPPDSDGHSSVWRPAIEDHSQNLDDGVRSALVSAVRDAAVCLARKSEDDLQAVVALLESQTLLHRRIALSVLSVVAEGAELAADRIANRDIFDDYRLKHEYCELLRFRLGEIPQDAKRTFLDWVREGPDLVGYRQGCEERTDSAPSGEDETEYANVWKRDWFSVVSEHLSGDEAVKYEELVAEHGAAEHPDFSIWTESGFGGPGTPLTIEDLAEKSDLDVIKYLAEWRPTDDKFSISEPTMRGLGEIFEDLVESRPAEFAALAQKMKPLDPTYIRSFFSGIETAVKGGASVSWDEVFNLMIFVLDRPFEIDETSRGFDRDPGWGWTRGHIATLLQTGLERRDNSILFESRDTVWSLLESLSRDPSPTPEHEATFDDSSFDPYTKSINVNRGKAMHAVVRYALWCQRELKSRDFDTTAWFELMPEVRGVLETHLHPGIDPSLAVRAVYGRWLPWLVLLDEKWVSDNLDSFFPSSPDELAALRDAAWSTYVGWCPPYDNVLSVLRNAYEAAVERVPTQTVVGLRHGSLDAKLGEHLVTFHWRGRDVQGLLERWFERADDELVAKVMNFVGRALRDTEGDIDSDVRERIRKLWDSRLQEIAGEPQSHKSEAAAFARTFASAKFDDDWSLSGLEVTLRAGCPSVGHDVIERLCQIAGTRSAEATLYTLNMLRAAANDWDHSTWREPVWHVLAATEAVVDAETVENRAEIVDHYVKRGDLRFREFAPRATEV